MVAGGTGLTETIAPSQPAPDPSSSSASAVARTITPSKGSTRSRLRPGRPPSPGFKKDVAVLRGSGMTAQGVAQVLGVKRNAIERIQRLPDVRADIQAMRLKWKEYSQDNVAQMAGETWTMAHEFVKQRDSKSFDNTMRGIAAMEKVSASVSGEGQKVEVTGFPLQSPQIELKALLVQLLGTPGA